MTLPLVFIFHHTIHHTGRWERTPLHQMAFLTAILKLKDSDVTTGHRLVLFLLQDQIPKQCYPFQVTFAQVPLPLINTTSNNKKSQHLVPGTVANDSRILLTLTTIIRGRYHCYPHFTELQMELPQIARQRCQTRIPTPKQAISTIIKP